MRPFARPERELKSLLCDSKGAFSVVGRLLPRREGADSADAGGGTSEVEGSTPTMLTRAPSPVIIFV